MQVCAVPMAALAVLVADSLEILCGIYCRSSVQTRHVRLVEFDMHNTTDGLSHVARK